MILHLPSVNPLDSVLRNAVLQCTINVYVHHPTFYSYYFSLPITCHAITMKIAFVFPCRFRNFVKFRIIGRSR